MNERDRGRQSQVEAAYSIFQKLLPEMMKDHGGEWVIMKFGDEEPYRGYWHCMKDANKVAKEEIGGKNFIIQEVTANPIVVTRELGV